MKKIILIIIAVLLAIFILIVLAGMYKFNYLAYQPGYDVDGNNTSLTAKEVKDRFNNEKKDIDIADLLILNEEEYKKTLANHNDNKKSILDLFSESSI